MVKVESVAIVTALASLFNVQGLQLEVTSRRPTSWVEHKTLSGKPVEKEEIEVNKRR
jgi:hypothetical protein